MVPPGDSPGKMFSTIHKERAGKAPELWCGESESPDETPGAKITHKKCAQSTHTRFAQTKHTQHTKHRAHNAHAQKACKEKLTKGTRA